MDDIFNLVGLQVADHVPFGAAADGGDFLAGFLDVIFAQQQNSRLQRLQDAPGLHGFAHRHQPDACRVAIRAGRGRGDSFADLLNVGFDFLAHAGSLK